MRISDLMESYEFIEKMNEPYMKLEGRASELRLMKESMYKKRMKNILLIGNAGCGKTALVEQFAYDNAFDFTVLSLNMTSVVANTKYRGEFEGKMTKLLRDIVFYNEEHPDMPVILFIDEIHTILNAGASEGGLSAANILKPYLSNRKITIIGATTVSEFKKTIARDPAVERRLSPVFVPDLDKDAVIKILHKFSRGTVSYELLDYIYRKADAIGGTNPDKSIELLDRAMARRKCSRRRIDEAMIDEIEHTMARVSEGNI